jgi:16S rRNA (guanine527-N7)-methyltransferase
MTNFAELTTKFQLSKDQEGQLRKLLNLFVEKNQELNLSAIRNAGEIISKHFYDSLVAAKYLQSAESIVDLGSGGGFPVLPLAICHQEKQFLAVDSVQKKSNVILEFAQKLKLDNVKISTKRIEELGRNSSLRQKFDLVTARALAKFPTLLELALPLIKIKGKLIAFRGDQEETHDQELVELMGAKIAEIVPYVLPTGENRQLWLIEKKQATLVKFPRKIGIPKKKPLRLSDF